MRKCPEVRPIGARMRPTAYRLLVPTVQEPNRRPQPIQPLALGSTLPAVRLRPPPPAPPPGKWRVDRRVVGAITERSCWRSWRLLRQRHAPRVPAVPLFRPLRGLSPPAHAIDGILQDPVGSYWILQDPVGSSRSQTPHVYLGQPKPTIAALYFLGSYTLFLFYGARDSLTPSMAKGASGALAFDA